MPDIKVTIYRLLFSRGLNLIVVEVFYRHTLAVGQGLPAEGRESSPNTRMIRRGRCLEVVESSITPA